MAAPNSSFQRRYPPEMRERAVRMVREAITESGERVGAVTRLARQLGIGPESLRNRVRQADIDHCKRPGMTTEEQRRIAELASLIKDPPPDAPVPPILPPQDGYLLLDSTKFRASFAADVDAEKAAFMADSQVPWGVAALSGSIDQPVWKTKPSWYLVATDDKMIPPPAQRFMSKRAGSTVTEVPGSHAIYVSQPVAVAALIERAARG